MALPTPPGYHSDPHLTGLVQTQYHALTGGTCTAEVFLSDRMQGKTAGLYRCLGPRHLIVLSRRYRELAPPHAFLDLVRHELAHYHLAVSGEPRAGHGPSFRRLMREWNFCRFPDATILHQISAAHPTLRHLYLCPAGHEHWLARHPSRTSSCGRCSRRFDRRFLLRYAGRSERR